MKKFIITLLLIMCIITQGKEWNENSKLAFTVATMVGLTYWSNGIFDAAKVNAPNTLYRANNTRGLFDGLDRETHFVGGIAAYYWMRNRGNTKAKAVFNSTLMSLAWELKDALRFMNHKNKWFHKTSVGNLAYHFAGDGFDIKDHYCVMLGIGTAIVFEYGNELFRKYYPKTKLSLNLTGVELRF